MYYLKCSECGEYIEITSELQTHCSVCTARLDNTYTIWKTKHPKKTFEDFLKLATVPEKRVLEKREKQHKLIERPVTSKWSLVLKYGGWTLAAAVVLAAVLYYTWPEVKEIWGLLDFK